MATFEKQKKKTKSSLGASNLKQKTLRVGDVCNLKITALAPNNVGIDEYTYSNVSSSNLVFVPNAQIGETVKAKIKEVKKINKDITYSVAQVVETLSRSEKTGNGSSVPPVKAGDVLDVTIPKQSKQNPRAGIVELSPNYKMIIPITESILLPKTVKVKVTRVKANYAFGNLVSSALSGQESSKATNGAYANLTSFTTPSIGCKFTTKLPSNCQQYGKYMMVKFQGKVLFFKVKKGVVLGRDKVRIKVISQDSTSNCLIGKMREVPNYSISKTQKSALVMKSIREMLENGMHFGEKAVKCHARMKPYLWTVKKNGSFSNTSVNSARKASVRTIRGRHVINLLKTRRCLNKALNTLTKYALKGRTFLFIGTKKPAANLVERASFFTRNSFYVNTRWLGGMLTNWKTICKSISKIRPILKEKQKVVRDILDRRQSIKARLIKKALLLKTKGKLILTKGRALLSMFKDPTKRSEIALRFSKMTASYNAHTSFATEVKRKQRKLVQKNKELMKRTLLLKIKAFSIKEKYKETFNQFTVYMKKLREYKFLLSLIKEVQQLENVASQEALYSVSNFKNEEFESLRDLVIPNPPKEILNLFAKTVKNQNSQVKIAAKSAAGNIVVCSSLLLRFAREYRSYIKNVMKTLIAAVKTLYTQCKNISVQLNTIKTTLQNSFALKNQYNSSLQQLKVKTENERTIIQMVKRELKTLEYQKKFIKFLPRLTYLPTQKNKISSIVQVLLSKIVDPKLKYPIDPIYDQKLSNSSKKLAAARKKKWQRLEKYFGGIANMTKLSLTKRSNTIAIIIGQKEEMNAVRECQKLGMKTFTIVDTNCDPSLSNHIIPANDDSRNSIQYILNQFITRIRLAQKIRSRVQKFKKTNEK